MTAPIPQQLLALPIIQTEVEVATLGEFFIELLSTLWRQGSGFSSKRPFGLSSWQYDVYKPMVEAGFLYGEFDDEGYLQDVDTDEADRMIEGAIRSLLPTPAQQEPQVARVEGTKRVLRYVVPVQDDPTDLDIENGPVVAATTIRNTPYTAWPVEYAIEFWVLTDTTRRLATRRFQTVGTGHGVPPDAIHQGTCPRFEDHVWHLFELPFPTTEGTP